MNTTLKERFAHRDTVLRIKDSTFRLWAMPQYEGDTGAVVAVLVPVDKRTRLNTLPIVESVVFRRRPMFTRNAVPLSFLRKTAGSPDWRNRMPSRPRLIGGMHFDMRLIARALACLPACPSVRIEVADTSKKYEGKADTLRIVGDKWRIVVANMRGVEGPALEFPGSTEAHQK